MPKVRLGKRERQIRREAFAVRGEIVRANLSGPKPERSSGRLGCALAKADRVAVTGDSSGRIHGRVMWNVSNRGDAKGAKARMAVAKNRKVAEREALDTAIRPR